MFFVFVAGGGGGGKALTGRREPGWGTCQTNSKTSLSQRLFLGGGHIKDEELTGLLWK